MPEAIPTIMNHVSIAVTDADRSLAFYDKVLGVIGAKRVMEHPGAIAYRGCRKTTALGDAALKRGKKCSFTGV